MIKSKLISVISSIGLMVTLGIGGFNLNSKEEKIQDNTVKTESKVEASKEANDTSNEVVNTENNNNNTNKDVTNETNNSNEEIANNSSEVSTNNKIDNSKDEVECDVEGVSRYRQPSKKPSSNKPSNNTKPSTPSNPPAQTPSNPPAASESNYIAAIEQAIFQRVNQERTAAGLPALSYNTTMEKYARIKSKDMGDNGYFAHEDKQGNLITVKMKADGVSYRAWGENIAYIQGMNDNNALATKFMDNWMNSSGHRANMLSTNFSSIGVGVYKIGNTYYATQEFYK